MKGLNTKQYGAESGDGDNVAIKNHHDIEVGKNVNPPSLHGKHTLETKRKFAGNEANEVDMDEDMALDVRKAVVLDYIEGGGDGEGTSINSKIGKFMADNPGFIEHTEVDELYPKA